MVWIVDRISMIFIGTFRTCPSGIDVANRPDIGWNFSRSNWGSCMRFCQVGAETDFFRQPNQTPMTSFVSCVAQSANISTGQLRIFDIFRTRKPFRPVDNVSEKAGNTHQDAIHDDHQCQNAPVHTFCQL